MPSPKGEGGPAGPNEGVSFRAADHKRAAETSLALISQRAGPLTASVYALRAAFGGCAPTRACGRSPSGKPLELTGAFSPWGRRWPAGRMRGELSLVARFFAISPFKHKRTRACARVFYASYYRAFLAVSTRALKLAGSWMAISDSILRFSSTPAFFRPFMKVE